MRMNMVNVSTTIPLGWKMSAQGNPQVFNEQWENPNTSGTGCIAGFKTTLYSKIEPLYTYTPATLNKN